MALPAFGTRVEFCRYSPLLYRIKTLSSWAAVSSIPQWSSPLKAEEKNDLDEEHPAQDKTRFHLNEALSMGALWCPAPWQGCDVAGNPWVPTSQVSHLTWPRHSRGWLVQLVASGLQTQNTGENSPQEINISQYREHQSFACSLAIAQHNSFSLQMHTGARHWKTLKPVLQATTLVSKPLPW